MFSKEELDCKHTIFLLTTNVADRHILNYWERHHQELLQVSMKPAQLQHVLQPLVNQIKAAAAGSINVSVSVRKGVAY
jgi:hypothetical protein